MIQRACFFHHVPVDGGRSNLEALTRLITSRMVPAWSRFTFHCASLYQGWYTSIWELMLLPPLPSTVDVQPAPLWTPFLGGGSWEVGWSGPWGWCRRRRNGLGHFVDLYPKTSPFPQLHIRGAEGGRRVRLPGFLGIYVIPDVLQLCEGYPSPPSPTSIESTPIDESGSTGSAGLGASD